MGTIAAIGLGIVVWVVLAVVVGLGLSRMISLRDPEPPPGTEPGPPAEG